MQTDDELDQLTKDFTTWRVAKKHRAEVTPKALLARAKKLSAKFGPTAVRKATRIDTALLHDETRATIRVKEARPLEQIPRHSIVTLPHPPSCLAELDDQASGVVLRFYSDTPANAALMAAFIKACRGGAA